MNATVGRIAWWRRLPQPADGLKWRIAAGWGTGGTVLSAVDFAKTLLLAYLVDFVGVPAIIAGAMIAITKFYDALMDPVVGVLSDRTASTWGRRRPFMLAGALACGAAYFVMFQVPRFSSAWVTDAYVFTTLIFYATSYALFSVPYRAMAAELTDDYHGRSTLMSIGSVFSAVGSLVGTSSAPALIAHYGGGRQGHEKMAVVMGLGTCAIGLVCFALTRGARSRPPTRVRAGVRKAPLWSLFLTNRPFVILLGSGILRGIAVSFMNGTAVFYTRWILKVDYAWLSRFFLLLTGSLILSLPFWVWFSRRIGKKNAFLIGTAMFGAGSLLWPFSAGSGDPTWLYLLRTLSMGIGSGALLSMGQSMLPDTIEYDRRTTGMHREGVFAGFFTTSEKASNAAGVAIVGIALGASGYVPSASTGIAQPHGALLSIYLCFAVIPALLLLASGAVMLLYPITEQYLHGLRRQTGDPDATPLPAPAAAGSVAAGSVAAGSLSVAGPLSGHPG